MHSTLFKPPHDFLKNVQAIFFDMDDTLCAYSDAMTKAIIQTLKITAPEGISPEELYQAWKKSFKIFYTSLHRSHWYKKYLVSGDPTRIEVMRRALFELGIKNEKLASQMSSIYRKERNYNLKLYPGAKRILSDLSHKYAVGMITNGPADIQREEIETLGIQKYFKHIFIEGELGIGKPSLYPFQAAQKAVDLLADEIVMIGDNLKNDIAPAKSLGWKTVYIAHQLPQESASKSIINNKNTDFLADIVVSNFEELSQLFN